MVSYGLHLRPSFGLKVIITRKRNGVMSVLFDLIGLFPSVSY